ncbi:MAG: lysophospholipid acyltransferase family protein [Pseudomonadota bacterium]
MESAPKLHNATLWATIRSAVQWFFGGLALAGGAISVVIASFFISQHALDTVFRPFVALIIWSTGVRLRVHGAEKLDFKKPYIFTINHINFLDHFFLYHVIGGHLRGVQKDAHFRWPFYGILARRMGLVPIPPRGDTQRAMQSLAKVREVFVKGFHLVMMPEGTRSKDGELQPFKKGSFFLAVQCGATIVPTVLVGAYAFNRKGDWRFYPGPIDMYFEDSISTAGMTEADVTPLRDRVRAIIAKRIADAQNQAVLD